MPNSSLTTTLEHFSVELFLELFKFFGLTLRINSILSQTENKNTLSLVSEKDLKFLLEQSAKNSKVVLSPSNIKSLKLHAALLSSKSDHNLSQLFSIYPLIAYKELHTLIVPNIKCYTNADCTKFNDLISQAAQLKSLHTLELRSSTKNSAEILQNLIQMIFEEEECFLSLKRCRFDLEHNGDLFFQRMWVNRPSKLTKIEYLMLSSLLFGSFAELSACLPAVKSIKAAGITIHSEPRQLMPAERSLPWHIAYLIGVQKTESTSSVLESPPTSSSDRSFQHRIFVHVFDQCTQNNRAVITIILDIFKRLKKQSTYVELYTL